MQINTVDTILVDTSDMIHRGQYQKAYKLLNKAIQEPLQPKKQLSQVQEQLQITRRLLHVMIKLMKKYLHKFQDKSHRIQTLLVRSMEVVCNYYAYIKLFHELYLKQINTPNNHAKYLKKIFPQRKTSDELCENMKGLFWIQFHQQNFFVDLVEILQIQYLFHKYSRNHLDAQVSGLRMENLIIFSTKQNVPLWLLQIGARISHTLGNAQFENSQFDLAIKDYTTSFELNKSGVKTMLENYEKHKTETHPNFWICLIKLTQQLLLNLDMLAYCAECENNFGHIVESLNLASFIFKILHFIPSSMELGKYIEWRGLFAIETFQTYILQLADINKLMKQLYPHMKSEHGTPIGSSRINNNFENLQAELYKRMNYKKLAGQQFIISKTNKSLIPTPMNSSTYFFKGRQNKQKSIHFKQISSSHLLSQTNLSDNHYQGSTVIDTSKPSFEIQTSGCSPSPHSPKSSFYSASQKSFQKIKIRMRDEPKNFITQLLNLASKTYSKQDTMEITQTEPEKMLQLNLQNIQIKKKKALIPLLDKQVSAYIEQNINEKYQCLDINEVYAKCKKNTYSEQEMRKELPITLQVLGMQKEFGNGVLLVKKEDKIEFNKHFEFNILSYFDYLNSNQYSALASLQDKKEIRYMRLAQQKLIQSTNLVLKKNLIFAPEEEKKKVSLNPTKTNVINNSQDLEQQTNLLTFNFDDKQSQNKRSSLLHKHKRQIELSNTVQSNKQILEQQKISNRKLKQDEDQKKSERQLAMQEKDLQILAGKKAKDVCISYLSDNEIQFYDLTEETSQLQQKLHLKKRCSTGKKTQSDSLFSSLMEPSQLARSTENQSTQSRRHISIVDVMKIKQSISQNGRRSNIH